MVVEPTLSTPWKLVVLAIGITVFLLGYLAIGFAFLNREFAPLKAKQLPVLLLALISATCWWMGTLQALGVIQQTGIFRYCLLWGVWLQTVLGVQLHLTIYTFRILRLYYILVQVWTPTGFLFWTLVLSVWAPSLIMGMLPIFMPGRFFTTLPVPIKGFESGDPACDYFDPIYGNMLMGFGPLCTHVPSLPKFQSIQSP
jgi:hypothetical protein